MKEMPVAAWVRSYVLNQLEKGPVRVADLFRAGATEFGFTAHEMRAAAEYFAVSTHIANGELTGPDRAICPPSGGPSPPRPTL